MQLAVYDEILEDDPQAAREREHMAISRSIALLQEARAKGCKSREALDALHYLDRLWSILLEDLGHAENGLPRELRANLMSIGIWILQESENIRQERSQNLQGLIDISEIIAKGLA